MNTNHAKAIKGMSIANIVLAALGILGMLIAWAGLGVGGAAISGSGYDYFYTEDGLYFTTDDVSALLGMLGFLVFLVIVCAVLILVAGILGVRGAAKPEKLRGIMIWNIVAAVVSLLSCCWVSLVLCIIVAVFANKDRALYAAPAPAAPYGYAPAAAPVAPVAPQQPVQPAAAAPQQPAAPAAAAPAAQPAPAAAPAPSAALSITSPMVGTFYRAPSPGAAPFIEVGDHVKKGQVIGIIEAMKLLNEVEADQDGVVKAFAAENGQPVEFGQPLVILE